MKQHYIEIPSWLGFGVALVATLLSSGGLILGIGAFQAKAIEAGHILNPAAASPIFNGGIQMLTWGSVLWTLALGPLGPRFVACSGAAVAAIGHILLGYALTPGAVSDTSLLMLAYGLLGCGGNGIFNASVSFANLFPGHEGLCSAILTGAFNGSSCIFLLLNLKTVPFEKFFQFYLRLVVVIGLVAAMMYPDTLVAGPQALWLRFPLPAIWSKAWWKGRVCMVVMAVSGYVFLVCIALAVTLASAEKSTAKMIAATVAAASLLASIVAAKLAFSSIDLLSEVRPFVQLPRLWGFMLSFSWCALVSVWVGGALPDIASSYFDASGANFFNSWAYPILGNCTIIFSPFVGMLIDKFGWPLPSTLLIIVTQLCLLLLLVESAVAQYFTLIFFNLVQAVGNTLLFSYLQVTFPKDAFPGLLALTLSVTGLFGFIAWPGLATNPFSSWTPIIVMLLLPTMLLFWWPVHEMNLMKAKNSSFSKTENLSYYGSI
eukprot:gnl/MRDRNA2_/MRDRNA2_78138_c0_seq1.p1 gnl/MRDRNA2_/MRDRNA2_78138_c0~~gnl/MRDRNA2_/MRDRNA2_78138_c0_seq1.p1  ORF type:complete len:488 (+),score=66.64 gnl/MRDRNA2_/MRDRNA2_78138_c0_seq1:116-1579(+)